MGITEIAPDGYPICPECGHHTSAYSGACTVLVPLQFDSEGYPSEMTYCNCDCRVVLGGKSIAEILWGHKENDQQDT